jgi:hypothetical protein
MPDRTGTQRYRCLDEFYVDEEYVEKGDLVEAIQLAETNIDAVRKWFPDRIIIALMDKHHVLVGGVKGDPWDRDEDGSLIWRYAGILSVGNYIVKSQGGDICEADADKFNEHFVPEE